MFQNMLGLGQTPEEYRNVDNYGLNVSKFLNSSVISNDSDSYFEGDFTIKNTQ